MNWQKWLSVFALAALAASEAIEATDKSLEKLLEAKTPVLLDLYAPWCGHCKTLAPIYDELADQFAHSNKVAIVKMDGEKNRKTAKKYNLEYFPTLKFIDAEGNDEDVNGRDLDSLAALVTSKTGVRPRAPAKPQPASRFLETEELAPAALGELLSKEGPLFVAFTATWCGHCQRLKPTWEELAKLYSRDKVVIAQVDCTDGGAVCQKYASAGYPTIAYFDPEVKDVTVAEVYKSGRSLDDLSAFVNSKTGLGRATDGSVTEDAGVVPALNDVIKAAGLSGDRYQTIADGIDKVSKTLTNKLGEYAKVYKRIASKAADNKDYVAKETARVKSILSKGTLNAAKSDELKIKLNILRQYVVGKDEL